MLASLADAPLEDPALVYEPKYDGIRATVEVPAAGHGRVRLWSRLGNEKTAQFPEIATALEHWSRKLKQPLVIDGEIVALDDKGQPTGFQQLQGRIHVGRTGSAAPILDGRPTALIAFDLLREGDRDLRDRPLLERRKALERIFSRTGSPLLRISEIVRGDGRALYQRALSNGWEGLIAKQADSRYASGKRSPDWRKLKIVHEQEFVIGGWTEPRQTRVHFGALLLGVYDSAKRGQGLRTTDKRRASKDHGPGTNDDKLTYVGHTGTGFGERELTRLMKLMQPLESSECPFRARPPSNERPHWVTPTLVAQVKFTEWTADGKLRHPVYVGLRDDKNPEDVVRETKTRVHASSARLTPPQRSSAEPRGIPDTTGIVEQLRAIEDGRGDGALELPNGMKLSVTNLRKIFWPKQKFTKGDLLRYYAEVAPFILPAVADRPLVMKRYPNGIAGAPFYQHRAQHAPAGVRVEIVPAGYGSSEPRPQFIGGDLVTLLHMTQLASISQDPWFSRMQSLDFADYVALDLDPSAGVGFAQVLDVARWIHEELEALGAVGVPKTSGAEGVHIYLPLPPETPYEAGMLLCQIIATVVARKHPKQATIERFVKARGKTVYVDYLQNIQGKTLATAYSARSSDYAGVSTPLTWKEIHEGVRREDFTIATTPARFRSVGDLWSAVRKSKGLDLSKLERYTKKLG
jgi:bifunctional non-homologous end joining protein LigD